MLGGLVVARTDGTDVVARPLALDYEWRFVVVVPDEELATADARRVLPERVPFADANCLRLPGEPRDDREHDPLQLDRPQLYAGDRSGRRWQSQQLGDCPEHHVGRLIEALVSAGDGVEIERSSGREPLAQNRFDLREAVRVLGTHGQSFRTGTRPAPCIKRAVERGLLIMW